MTWKKYWLGVCYLILVPCLVLVGLGAVVHLINAQPTEGRLTARVQPQVVFPWDDAAYFVDFDGSLAEKRTPKPIDMVFVVDTSNSMRDSLPEMARAATELAKMLSEAEPDMIRYAMVTFSDDAKIEAPFEPSPEKLFEGLKVLQDEGGTQAEGMFNCLEELEKQVRGGARKVAVFYTDGEIAEPDAVAVRAEALGKRGWEFFAVGLPGRVSSGLMVKVTGGQDRVFDPYDQEDMASQFAALGSSILESFGRAGLLAHRLDGRHFSAPLDGTQWHQGGDGALNRTLGLLPIKALTVGHPLKPLSAGLWQVGIESPRLDYLDVDSVAQFMEVQRKPLLLVMTWFALFLFLLPALLWLIFMRPEMYRAGNERAPAEARTRQRHQPARLPELPQVVPTRQNLLPTLFIGLGEAGREALEAACRELHQADCGQPDPPYVFLHLELDARTSNQEKGLTSECQIDVVLPPPAVTRLNDYLPQPNGAPDHLAWFPATEYRDSGRPNLGDAARSDRRLARLALFQWLAEGSLIDHLRRANEALTDLPSTDGSRQIMVFGSPDDGFGSGCLIDIGRLCLRLQRDLQNERKLPFAAEAVAVLCSPDQPDSDNAQAMAVELQSARLCGAFPQRTTYEPNHGLLDRVDSETPFYRVLKITGTNGAMVAAQCGDLAASMTERLVRNAVLERAAQVSQAGTLALGSTGLHVIPTEARDRVKAELMLRILGPDILLDLETAADGSLTQAVVPDDRALELYDAWISGEQGWEPLYTCLAATRNEAYLPRVSNLLQLGSTDDIALALENQFISSVSTRLHGKRAPEGDWRRDWKPAESVAVLELAAHQLDQLSGRLAEKEPGKDTLVAGLQMLANLARSTALDLKTWSSQLADACAELMQSMRAGAQHRESLKQLPQRTYLLTGQKESHLEEVTACLQKWLRTKDTLTPLRERFFFEVRRLPEGGVGVGLTSYLERSSVFYSAREALSALSSIAFRLASMVPAARISGPLLSLKSAELTGAANGLIERGNNPMQVLLLTPDPEKLPSVEATRLGELIQAIPQPADHGQRQVVQGMDHAAVRRITLSSVNDPYLVTKNFVQSTEQAAERVRRDMERAYEIRVGMLPPELRIAIGQSQAFSAFARAYRSGDIVKMEDGVGTLLWYAQKAQCFLSSDASDSLARAAAYFVWHVPPPYIEYADTGGDDLFEAVREWVARGGATDADTLVKAAVELHGDHQEVPR